MLTENTGALDAGGATPEVTAHLWAVGYDDERGADRVRDAIMRLGWDKPYLDLDDIAVVVRHADGNLTLNHEPSPQIPQILGLTLVCFLAGLVTAMPLMGAVLGFVVGSAKSAAAAAARINAEFLRDVEKMMKPGTSALFILDQGGEIDVILHEIRGLGGTILKTNVDVAKARVVQSSLTASADEGQLNPQ
jgi:uncharacterized membrane protein